MSQKPSTQSELKRLNFQGFYTMVLERGDELISVATVRIHGIKVAEMPLIGTSVQYRQQGMCRRLVNELEKVIVTSNFSDAAKMDCFIWLYSDYAFRETEIA
ncbi:hypothetical protein ACLOJK_036832 [Asimina triloba]